MVMMVMMAGVGGFRCAGFFVAVFALVLQLQRDVADAVFAKLGADGVLDRVGLAVCHQMHGGAVVQTPGWC